MPDTRSLADPVLRLLYTLLAGMYLPVFIARLFIRGLTDRTYRARWPRRFGFIEPGIASAPVIWVHAVSVGEVNASVPLVRRLLSAFPRYQVLITTVTPTGADTVRTQFGGQVRHSYLPYDLPFFINTFLHRCRPGIVLVMETEIWPNLYRCCHRLGIPLLLINARLSEKSMTNYRRVASLARRVINDIDLIATQTREDADRFLQLGAESSRITVMGNLKFDAKMENPAGGADQLLFPEREHIWIAASTHAGEEEILLDAHRAMIKLLPDSLLILVPRHPGRARQIAALCRERQLGVVLRTGNATLNPDTSVYIVNTLGELVLFYKQARFAFVGGSLVRRGGQNMLEAASLGLSIITGPHTYNFAAISHMLLGVGALVEVNSASELTDCCLDLFSNDELTEEKGSRARRLVERNTGAVDALLDILVPYLSPAATHQEKCSLNTIK